MLKADLFTICTQGFHIILATSVLVVHDKRKCHTGTSLSGLNLRGPTLMPIHHINRQCLAGTTSPIYIYYGHGYRYNEVKTMHTSLMYLLSSSLDIWIVGYYNTPLYTILLKYATWIL